MTTTMTMKMKMKKMMTMMTMMTINKKNADEEMPLNIIKRKMYIKNKIIEANSHLYKRNMFYKAPSIKRVRFDLK